MLYVIQLNCKNVKNSFDYLFMFCWLAIVDDGIVGIDCERPAKKRNKLPILRILKNVINIRTTGKWPCFGCVVDRWSRRRWEH